MVAPAMLVGMRAMVAAFVLFAAAGAAGEEPKQLVITVGELEVTTTRPSTGARWDSAAPAESPVPHPICKALHMERGGTLMHAIFGGLATGAHAGPHGAAAGVVAGLLAHHLCEALVERAAAAKPRRADPTAPDLFVAIVAAPGAFYRTPTAPDAHSAVFHSRFRVPVAAVPADGLQLLVEDDEGAAPAETIAELRVSRERLLAAAKSSKPIVLADAAHGVTKLEIAVEPRRPEPFEGELTIPVTVPMGEVPGVYVDAGTELWIAAAGEYRAGAGVRSVSGPLEPITVADARHTLHFAPFDRAPQGAVVALVGAGHTLTALTLKRQQCVGVLVSTPGFLALGVNSDEVANNSGGPLRGGLFIFDAGAEAWTHPGREVPCSHLIARENKMREARGLPPIAPTP
jgi:predicted lipid-binding transport protein (Tim44 family)